MAAITPEALQAAGIPEHLCEVAAAKLSQENFDAGGSFQLAVDEDGDYHVIALRDMSASDPNSIFLVDHLWTYLPSMARKQLEANGPLLQRLTALFFGDDYEPEGSGVDVEEDKQKLIDAVEKRLWKTSGTYTVGGIQSDPVWYLMDELGSRFEHCRGANFKFVPVFAGQMAFSLLWPVEDVEEGALCSRDYLNGEPRPTVRAAKAAAWGIDEDSEEGEEEGASAAAAAAAKEEEEEEGNTPPPPPPAASYSIFPSSSPPPTPKGCVYVRTDLQLVREFLNDPRFLVALEGGGGAGGEEAWVEVVEGREQAAATVLWSTQHFREFDTLEEGGGEGGEAGAVYVSEFENERCLTVKDLLARTAARSSSSSSSSSNLSFPDWLPETYNLHEEGGLLQLTREFQRRKAAGEPNVWIVKAWNKTRSADITVTDDLLCILRLTETGPKVACRYITRPALTLPSRLKFDLRFMVGVASTHPLVASVYRSYVVRTANQPFALDSRRFNDFETHFTVMNYLEGAEVQELSMSAFEEDFDAHYPNATATAAGSSCAGWSGVKQSIYAMLRDVFASGTAAPPPKGLGRNAHCRGLYGVDVMLEVGEDEAVQPLLVEVNYMPDCRRLCQLEPEFFNDVFCHLFLGENRTSPDGEPVFVAL